MKTEMGEYLVGAYLKMILKCDVVDYNVRPPGGGLEGLGELDVIGMKFETGTAYLCEVTTHIDGLLYVNNSETVDRILRKHKRQKEYANNYLGLFPKREFMFWSPVVPTGQRTEGLSKIDGLKLIINGKYKSCVEELVAEAKKTTHDSGNPVFRVMQILQHLRD